MIDDGGVLKVSNVSIFGLPVSDFRASFRDSHRNGGVRSVLSMLDTRVKRSQRKFPAEATQYRVAWHPARRSIQVTACR